MAVAAPVAIGLSLAGAGLSAAGEISKARGQAAGYQFQEAQAQRKAAAARVAADQTDAALREELTTTLGNIGAIRAAAGIDPSSPTTDAIMQRETLISDRNRMIKVGNLNSQAEANDDAAGYYRYAAESAMNTGYMSAFASVIKGIGGAAGGGLSGWGGGADTFSYGGQSWPMYR
ncbi:hypothetical protein [Afipia carboxidovorans]|uniref:hypothetical protein n=1 Tax=Afipia carboxidovorans TaxID=40137 RepID=UPI003089B23F|nr:hypothetical protein CRBSH125_06060 [Afipia carboxidovorans]